MATPEGKLTARRLVITFVPRTGKLEDSRRAAAVTQLPSESSQRTKVYRRDDRGVVGVESLSLQGLAFVVIHTSVGRDAHCQGFQMRVATPSAVCAAVIAVLWAPGGPRCTPAHAPAIV